jgi:DNA primase
MIGYAPNDWRQALQHLQMLGYTQDEIVEAGVAARNEQGNVYDRFRHRLMIPIRDGRGSTVGFGARALEKDAVPKYLNSPQGPLFDKSRLLYGLDMARRAIRETETVIVVEGYMDAIQAHQAGFVNVVAQMGTALTEEQLRQLDRYASRLILALGRTPPGSVPRCAASTSPGRRWTKSV